MIDNIECIFFHLDFTRNALLLLTRVHLKNMYPFIVYLFLILMFIFFRFCSCLLSYLQLFQSTNKVTLSFQPLIKAPLLVTLQAGSAFKTAMALELIGTITMSTVDSLITTTMPSLHKANIPALIKLSAGATDQVIDQTISIITTTYYK
jgi:hypothetical protein